MKIVLFGDTHGLLDKMYADAIAQKGDAIIQVGDTGIFGPNANIDPKTARRGFPRDHEKYLLGQEEAPMPTYFIKGNHEDYDLLADAEANRGRLAHNMTYVPNGTVLELGGVRFGVIGGNYSPSYFERKIVRNGRRRHFLKSDLDSLAAQEFDILISHDGPNSEALPKGSRILTAFVEQTRPRQNIHGHHHHAYETRIGETKVIGLARSHMTGGMMVLDE